MISPIIQNGVVAGTQNVNLINRGDESRAQVNYQQSQSVVEQQREDAHSTVISSQNSDRTDTRHDARQEGKNKYYNNRKDNKNKGKDDDSFGEVVVKREGGGFDISV